MSTERKTQAVGFRVAGAALALLLAASSPALGVPHDKALAPAGKDSPKLKVGDKAPRLAGTSPAGETFALAWSLQKQGIKAVVVSFWSIPCKHCRKGLKALDRLARGYGQAPVRFILVSCDQPDLPRESQNRENLTVFLEQLQVFLDSQGIGLHRKKKSNLRMIWDNGLKHASRYGLYNSGAGSLSLPGTFVIDSKQKIRAVFGTEDSSFESQLGAHVDKLLK